MQSGERDASILEHIIQYCEEIEATTLRFGRFSPITVNKEFDSRVRGLYLYRALASRLSAKDIF